MPCYQTGSLEGDRAQAYKEDALELNRKVTKLTRMLCLAAKALEDNNVPFPHGLSSWWNGHKVVDSKQRAINQAKNISRARTVLGKKNVVEQGLKDNSPKPWTLANEYGEGPGDICCQRAVGKVCFEHNPKNYVKLGNRWVTKGS